MSKPSPFDIETIEAIERVERSNEDFIIACLRFFEPGVLPKVFSAGDITRAAMERGYEPTDWRAIGPVMIQAKALGLIENVGFAPRTKGPTARGHASRDWRPTYQLRRPPVDRV